MRTETIVALGIVFLAGLMFTLITPPLYSDEECTVACHPDPGSTPQGRCWCLPDDAAPREVMR